MTYVVFVIVSEILNQVGPDSSRKDHGVLRRTKIFNLGSTCRGRSRREEGAQAVVRQEEDRTIMVRSEPPSVVNSATTVSPGRETQRRLRSSLGGRTNLPLRSSLGGEEESNATVLPGGGEDEPSTNVRLTEEKTPPLLPYEGQSIRGPYLERRARRRDQGAGDIVSTGQLEGRRLSQNQPQNR